MDFIKAFKSIVDDLDYEITLIDLEHTIVYMNKESIRRYAHRGGEKLVGQSLFGCHNERSKMLIEKFVDMLKADDSLHEIRMAYNPKHDETNYIIAVRDEDGKLIGYYERHDKGEVE